MEQETERLIEKLLNGSYDLAINHAVQVIEKYSIDMNEVVKQEIIASLSKLKKDTQ